MKLKLITHTGADIPISEASDLGVSVVYDIVVLNGVSYKNMLEISANEFYDGMKTCTLLPTSSHPSVGDFCDVFRSAAKDADEVLFLSITSKMSGTYSTACAAEKIVQAETGTPIYVYDTLQCSQGMALMVREAVRLASEGLNSTRIMEKLDAFREKVGVYFILDTLKYAKAGGRVGAIKALAADALGIKPILCFSNGLVNDIGIARSFNDGLKKVLSFYKSEGDKTACVTVFHQAAPEKAESIIAALKADYPNISCRTDDIGPVIGIYTGPGGAGIAFVKQ